RAPRPAPARPDPRRSPRRRDHPPPRRRAGPHQPPGHPPSRGEPPMIKRDPSLTLLLRGDLVARSPLVAGPMRDAMLEALLDLLPSYTHRHPSDPGIALVEALAAVLEIFGFYH